MNLGDFLAELEAQRARLDTAIAGLRPLIGSPAPTVGVPVPPPKTRAQKTHTRTKASGKGARMQGQRGGRFGATIEGRYSKAVARVLAGEKVATVARDYEGVKGPTLQYRVNKAKRAAPESGRPVTNGAKAAQVPVGKTDPKTGRPWV